MTGIIKLKLDPNLKRISLISVAETLWKLSDVTEIAKCLVDRKSRSEFFRVYNDWEKVISKIVMMTHTLGLPLAVEVDLQEMIILMGQKIYFFYSELSLSECEICESVLGSAEYYFSNHGVLRTSCSYCHWKYTYPSEDLLKTSCYLGDTKVISKYKIEANAFLEYHQLDLNLKKKKDVVVNIITVFLYMFYRSDPHRWRQLVPENYLKNSDYVIPLEVALERFGIGRRSSGVNSYYRFLDSRNLLSDVLLDFDLFSNLETELRRISNVPFAFLYRFEDLEADDFLHAFQFLPPNQVPHFIEKNIVEIVIAFLPVWPYQELIPEILEDLFKKNFDLNYEFLLEFVALLIGFENNLVHRVKKPLYLSLFRDLWRRAPERAKVLLLVNLIEVLIPKNTVPITKKRWYSRLVSGCRAPKGAISFLKQMNIPISLSDKDLKKNEDNLNRIIVEKCEELVLNTENFKLVENFVNEIVISVKEILKFGVRHGFVTDSFCFSFCET